MSTYLFENLRYFAQFYAEMIWTLHVCTINNHVSLFCRFMHLLEEPLVFPLDGEVNQPQLYSEQEEDELIKVVHRCHYLHPRKLPQIVDFKVE